ncbi:class I SAM-dependent methyltransferase [bacterium]|nr:class I SAM-dependent methyltransferase [bacterium]
MICQHQNKKIIKKFNQQSLYLCNDCRIIISKVTNKQSVSEDSYDQYYKEENSGRFEFGLEYIIKRFRLNRARSIKNIYPQAKSALDIGCGRGFILYYLKHHLGFNTVVGTQISPPAVAFARKKLKLKIHDKDLLEINFDQDKFDVITMFHVLEHVDKPEKYIQTIYQLLNKQGKFIVEVPNFNAWNRRLSGKYWLSLDPDYHLTFFTPDSLSGLLKKYNFKIKKINTFSFEYSVFTSAQSLLSLITRSDHIIYSFVQDKKFKPILLLHLILFAIIWPLALLVNLIFYFSKQGEVLRIIAEK